MRFPCLLALPLVAAPLLAQEPSEQERRLVEEKRAHDERASEIRRIQDMREKSAALEAELRRLNEEVLSKTAASEEVVAAIKRANATLEELMPLIQETLETATWMEGTIPGRVHVTGPFGARTLYLGAVGSEAISGSADGTDYTLKSLGDGKYELHATKRDGDGKLMEEWKDKGTLKELQGKYAFLKSGLTLQVPPAVRLARVQEFAGGPAIARSWGDATFWNGGGKVGVTVVAPSEELRFHLELPEGAGFIVQQVVPGSRAEQIGIRRMDILLKLDGELIDSPIQLRKLNEKTGILEMIRRSETRKIDLATVPEPPAAATTEPVEVAPAGAR